MPFPRSAFATAPLIRSGHFGRLFLLRCTLLLALALLLNTESGPEAFLGYGGAALLVLAATNMLLLAGGLDLTRRAGFPLVVATTDTLLSAIVIFSARIDGPEILFLFAMVIFLVALGSEMKRIVMGTVAVAAVYWWLGTHYRQEDGARMLAAYLGRVTFLYCVALYFGYLVIDARQEKERYESKERERRELRTILDIIETATSSLDLHRVMATIVKKICEVIQTDRCSVLFLDKSPDRGWVIASSDSPEVDMLPVDLRKYPEVQEAITTRSSVIVDDIENHPLMEPVREKLRAIRFSSLLVVPLIFQDEMLGSLLLRAAKRKQAFGEEEIRFCQTVAGASVSALKNAMLYRQVRMEADNHRSTAEKLRNILENSMEIILTTDPEGTITDFNRSAESTFGYSRDQVIGRPITELVATDMERRDFLAKLRRSGTILERSTAVRRSDGLRLTLDLTFAVVRNDLGEMVGAVCVGKDPGLSH